MNSRQLRLLRAASATAAATLIAGVSHTLGGGAAPHPLLMIAIAALLTPVSALLIGVQPSRPRVAATVVVAQGVFHTLFQLLGAPTQVAVGGTHPHHHDLAALAPLPPAVSPAAWMIFAHAVAAFITVVLVWHAERMLRAIAGWVRALLRRALAAADAVHERPPALRSLIRTLTDAGPASAASGRGPPALARG